MWTLIREDERAAFARWDTLLVAVLRAPLDALFFDGLDDVLRDMAQSGEGTVSVLLVRAGASPGKMSGEARERAKDLLGHVDRLRALTYVNAGSGLKAKLLRGAMNAALTRASFPAKVFTDVEGALGWLSGLPGQDAAVRDGGDELRRTVNEFLAR